jgi:hypothetical protein
MCSPLRRDSGLLTYDEKAEVFTGPRCYRPCTPTARSFKNYAQIAASPVSWHPMLYLPESVSPGRNWAAEALDAEVSDYSLRGRDGNRRRARRRRHAGHGDALHLHWP